MSHGIKVTLWVLNAHAEIVRKLSEDTYWPADTEETHDGTTYFEYGEAGVASLPFLDSLLAQGISYDNDWIQDDLCGGSKCQRFTSQGESVYKDLYNAHSNPDIEALLNRIDKPMELRNYILEHMASRLILPWDNQEQYGQLYRARRLIHAM